MRNALTVVFVMVLLLAGLVGFSGRIPGPGALGAQGEGQGATVQLEADDIAFSPEEIAVSAGDTIVLSNVGVLEHNFAIEGYNDAAPVNIPIGGQAEWVVPSDLAPGTYEFYCAVPGHRSAGMHGVLTVVGADEDAGEDADTSDSSAGDASPAAATDDDIDARVSALETQVAAQATQIAELEQRLDDLEDAGE
jgi:plastocyanin